MTCAATGKATKQASLLASKTEEQLAAADRQSGT